MKKITLLLFLSILLFSCKKEKVIEKETLKKPNKTKLYINKYRGVLVGGKVVKTDSLFIMNDDYFQIKLNSYPEGYHGASRDLKSDKGSTALIITDSLSNMVKFNDSNEFLNFMSKRNYNMQTQNKERFGIDYTFRKK